jgi:hypothetical protein
MQVGPAPVRNSAIAAARQELALTPQEVWLGYVSVGGDRTLAVMRTWLTGGAEIPDRDYDFIAQALNDRFIERGLNHPVAYSEKAV